MNIKEIIDRYNISPIGVPGAWNQIAINNAPKGRLERVELLNKLRPLKNEILAYFIEEFAAKIKAENDLVDRVAPGLSELRRCRDEWSEYRDEIRRRHESEDGLLSLPDKPDHTYEDLAAQYPRAAAYLKAESYGFSTNYLKAAAGRKALDAIRAGEDHKAAIAEMERWYLASDAMWN